MNFKNIITILLVAMTTFLTSCLFGGDDEEDAPTFNAQHYAVLNQDVVVALGDDYQAILTWYRGGEQPANWDPQKYVDHYNNFGVNENRAAIISLPANWDSQAYLNANPDLGAMSDAGAQEHYLLYGLFEGRPLGVTPVDPVDTNQQTNDGRLIRMGFVQLQLLHDTGTVNDIDMSRYTHLTFFSLIPNSDGTLNTSEWDNRPEQIAHLTAKANAAGVKLWVSIGGAGKSEHFGSVLSNASLAQTLTNEIVAFANTHNLAGVDVDWEYPGTNAQASQYASWLASLNSALGSRTLSVDAPTYVHSIIKSGSEIAPRDAYTTETFNAVDYFNIMAYDMDLTEGEVARYAATEATVNMWRDRGLDMSKAILGVPFYGRDWSSGVRKDMTWERYLIYRKANPVDRIYFTSEADRIKKVDLIINNNMAGIMYWEATQDQDWVPQPDGSEQQPEGIARWWDEQLKSRGK